MTDDYSIHYDLKTETEIISGTRLEVQSIRDLNRTIDLLFEHLEKTGNATLLEDLCPYFGVIWPSARALAEVMAEAEITTLRNQEILEIGCGLALPSLLIAKKGIPITATDFHPEVAKFLDRNRSLNQLENLEYLRLDWKIMDFPHQYDLVIGSDILYERQHTSQVAHILAKTIALGGQAIITDPGRPYLQVFADEMKSLGFDYDTATRTVFDDASPTKKKDIFILTFKKYN